MAKNSGCGEKIKCHQTGANVYLFWRGPHLFKVKTKGCRSTLTKWTLQIKSKRLKMLIYIFSYIREICVFIAVCAALIKSTVCPLCLPLSALPSVPTLPFNPQTPWCDLPKPRKMLKVDLPHATFVHVLTCFSVTAGDEGWGVGDTLTHTSQFHP